MANIPLWLDELGDRLVAKGPYAGLALVLPPTAGANLFLGDLPPGGGVAGDGPDIAVAVYASLPGGPPDFDLGAVIARQTVRFTVAVRHTDMATGMNVAELVWRMLATTVNAVLGQAATTTWYAITPMHPPYLDHRDSQGAAGVQRLVFAFDCEGTKALS